MLLCITLNLQVVYLVLVLNVVVYLLPQSASRWTVWRKIPRNTAVTFPFLKNKCDFNYESWIFFARGKLWVVISGLWWKMVLTSGCLHRDWKKTKTVLTSTQSWNQSEQYAGSLQCGSQSLPTVFFQNVIVPPTCRHITQTTTTTTTRLSGKQPKASASSPQLDIFLLDLQWIISRQCDFTLRSSPWPHIDLSKLKHSKHSSQASVLGLKSLSLVYLLFFTFSTSTHLFLWHLVFNIKIPAYFILCWNKHEDLSY